MTAIPVVKIQAETESGYMVINEADFDEKKDKLFVKKTVAKKPVVKDPEPEKPVAKDPEPKKKAVGRPAKK